MAEKEISVDQLTNKSFVTTLTKSLVRKMTNQYKTILAPQAPWPNKPKVKKVKEVTCKRKKVPKPEKYPAIDVSALDKKYSVTRKSNLDFSSKNLDYFAEEREELLEAPLKFKGRERNRAPNGKFQKKG